MKIFNAETLNLSHFNPQQYSYHSTNVHLQFEAIHITLENVGKLALEFEAELFRTGDGGYFLVRVERATAEAPEGSVSIAFRVGDWILPLRGELHVYSDDMFRATFQDGVYAATETHHEFLPNLHAFDDERPENLVVSHPKTYHAEVPEPNSAIDPNVSRRQAGFDAIPEPTTIMQAAQNSPDPKLRKFAENLDLVRAGASNSTAARAVRHKGSGAYGVIHGPSDGINSVWVKMADVDELVEYRMDELEFIS